MSCIDSITCEGTQPEDPVGVTGYWLFACSVSTAKVNRWASHLFTPLPAPDREWHGTDSRRSTSEGTDNSLAYLQLAKVFWKPSLPYEAGYFRYNIYVMLLCLLFSELSFKVNVRILPARRELKWKIKASKVQRCLVYIPAYSPTQHISFDTTDQF